MNAAITGQPDHQRLALPVAKPVSAIDQSLLICGDAESAMDLLPDEVVQTVVTSPPYWSLRDYGAAGQIGRDDDLAEYTGGSRGRCRRTVGGCVPR